MKDTKSKSEDRRTEQLQSELSRLTKLVYHDDLTGLFNRRGFFEEGERAFHLVSFGTTSLERRTGFQIPYSVIFLDIDNFKKLNDTHGHAAGDAALRIVADILRNKLRTGDLFARIGGEEFVAAIIGADSRRAAVAAEKLRSSLEQTKFEFEGVNIPLTASFGVAEYTVEKTLQELIEKADRAMYQAKQAGKNRVVASSER